MNNIKVIGVVGAGVMGVGVAQASVQAGFEVLLVDVNDAVLEKAKSVIKNNLRFHGLMTGSQETVNVEALLEKITFTTDLKVMKKADFVVENVVEKWEVKEEVYANLEKHCPEHCIYAVNTSAIPITKVASKTARAKQVIGMHFMNPVPMKPTVEVIKGFHTSQETIDAAESYLQQMDKKMVLVNDSPGFVSNRVLMLTINEAINLVQDDVATAEDVDEIFTSCFGHEMGPLSTADLIGLDTILYSIEVLHENFGEAKYRPAMLLKKMVDAGLWGRKSGEGFFTYS